MEGDVGDPSCPACGPGASSEYEENAGGYICTSCGAVLSSSVISMQAPTPSDVDKGTHIGGVFCSNRFGAVAGLSQSAARDARRISLSDRGQNRSMRRRQRLSAACQILQMPSWAPDSAMSLANQFSTSPSTADDTAALYSIARRLSLPVVARDVSDATGAGHHEVSRAMLRLPSRQYHLDTARLVGRAVASVNGTYADGRRATAIIGLIRATGICGGRQPRIVACAAVVVALRVRLSAKQTPVKRLASALDVNERRLRERVADIENALVGLASQLPIELSVTRRNLPSQLGTILDNLELLQGISSSNNAEDPVVQEYQDAVARYGGRKQAPISEVSHVQETCSGSIDLDALSGDDVDDLLFTDDEVRQRKKLLDRLESNTNKQVV
ncbi:TFIIB-type domain-containing protein [Plasmodiophora brassicae]|uniref:TFIIB-type domain-containing protein n=1 Tax=Plasmodiophora brassicae TaxID=37360 RepID=A0A0G4II03_PLABS|nr:hypothetical protein PBRA_003656 [Plasmodiophora brassicae]SPQ94176.1 unnamed protein product [Plasmodiophora brassicae]